MVVEENEEVQDMIVVAIIHLNNNNETSMGGQHKRRV